jgi:hypothetical protein
VRYSSVRTLLALANAKDLNLYGLDVSNAFARSEADMPLYVNQPTGYTARQPDGTAMCCKLKMNLYGTKQAARGWNQHLRKFLLENNWRQFESDPCIYEHQSTEFGTQYVGIYVDDIIHLAANKRAHTLFHELCNQKFPTTSQGELHWILNMKVTRDRTARTLILNQTQQITDYLTDIHMLDARPLSSPMESSWKYGNGNPSTDEKSISEYRSHVARIAYFATGTRPDIAYAVHCLSRHLSEPNKNCFQALNHLNRYLAGSAHKGLKYHFGQSTSLKMEAYSDASYGGEDVNSAKSTSGYVIYFGGGPIDWACKLQPVIALSSAEAEQVAAFTTSRTVFYFRQLLEELNTVQQSPTVIHEDNTACIAQSKNPVNHKRCKHILLKYHYLRDLTESGIVQLEYINTKAQIADLLTKPLAPKDFNRLLPFLVSST